MATSKNETSIELNNSIVTVCVCVRVCDAFVELDFQLYKSHFFCLEKEKKTRKAPSNATRRFSHRRRPLRCPPGQLLRVRHHRRRHLGPQARRHVAGALLQATGRVGGHHVVARWAIA